MKKSGIILGIIALVFSLSLTSCDAVKAFIDALYAIDGKVVNIKAPANGDYFKSSKNASLSLVGAVVTFTDSTDSTKKHTATVASDGTYKVIDVPNGKYSISATQNGWTFIPITFVVSSTTKVAPDLLAFVTAEAGTLTVVMTWENTARDMDLHMTWGTMNASASAPNSNHLQSTQIVAGADTKTGTGWTASLDRDVWGTLLTSTPLVETITLTASGGTISPNAGGSLPTADAVNNDQTFRFYIDAFNTTSGTTGDNASVPAVSPSGATLHFFQGSSHLGSYYAPFNTAERTLRIAKVIFDGTASNNYTLFTAVESTVANTYRGFDTPVMIGQPVGAIQ